jgi:hypothetical protein
MSRRVLVLVDLDNCLGAVKKPRTSAGLADENPPTFANAEKVVRRCLHSPTSAVIPDVAATVVVVALNSSTARDIPEKVPGSTLVDFARAFSEVVAGKGTPFISEFSLSLTMPESADVALAVLARNSPTDMNDGKFDTVVLFSGDTGLREDVAAAVGGTAEVLRDSHGRVISGIGWVCGNGCRRLGPLDATFPRAHARTPGRVTGFIEDEETTAWAWNQSVVASAARLDKLAMEIETTPALLTQIGLTFPGASVCVRGVDRLSRLVVLGTPPALGPCSHEDGLEVDTAQPIPGDGAAWYFHGTSSLDAGAVRLKRRTQNGVEHLTARTKLPVWTFSPNEQISLDPYNPWRVMDNLILRQHARHITPVRTSCEFVPGSGGARGGSHCRLGTDNPMRPPVTWWTMGRSATSKQWLPEGMLAHAIRDVPCEATLLPDGNLGYSYPEMTPENVVCPNGLAAGRIEKGFSGPAKEVVAVFAPSTASGSCSVTVRLIQNVRWDDVRDDLATAGSKLTPDQWTELQMLPLLVAQDAIDEPGGPGEIPEDPLLDAVRLFAQKGGGHDA